MRVTSPPKYHNERRSPLGSSPNLSIKCSDQLQQQQSKIPHFRSTSGIMSRSQVKRTIVDNNIQLPLPSPSDKRENLYNQLRSKEIQYVGLIKELHQENNNLKQEIVRLRQEEEIIKREHPGRVLSPGRMGNAQPIISNNAVNSPHAYNASNNPLIQPHKPIMNKTFSNFSPKVIQVNNTQQQQQQLNSFYKTQYCKTPLIMSQTSPDGFKGLLRNKSPCVRPVNRNNLPANTTSQNKTATNSNQPSRMIQQVSINESLQKSPRSLQIVNVLNTAISTPNRNIVFEQTDDTKELHMNPTGSKMIRQSRSIKVQQQVDYMKQTVSDTSDMKISQDQILNKLKHKMQQSTPTFELQSNSNHTPLEQSQCLAYIKPSLYNSNIRYSNDDDMNPDIIANSTDNFIHPIERNILTGFPILSKLRLAQSQFQKDVNQQNKQQQQQQKANKSAKNLSFNVIKSEGSKQSKLSSKISKQNQSQSYVDEAQGNRHNQPKPLMIIRMLEQTITNQGQSQGKIGKNRSAVLSGKQQRIRQQSQQSSQSSSNIIHKKPKQKLTSYDSPINLVCLQKQQPTTSKVTVNNVDVEQQQSDDETFEIEQPLPSVMGRLKGVEENQQQQQQLLKPSNFNNRLYYEDTQRDTITHGNEYEHVQQIVEDSKIKSVKDIVKRVRTNQMKSKSTVLPTLQTNSHSQYTQGQYQKQHQSQVNKFVNINAMEREDKSIDVTDRSNQQFSFKKQAHIIMNQSQPIIYNLNINNKENTNLASSSLTSQLNKTAPNPFSAQQKILPSINKRYLQNNFSLLSNQWGQASKSMKSHKLKRISNQAYL